MCCGDQAYLGINHGAVACFQEAEGICNPQYPACGCASFGATAEDGAFVPWDQVDGIVVECASGTCRSRWGGDSFPCGSATCIDGQYCSTLFGGPAGAPPSYACMQLPGGCSDCACVNWTGCTCAADSGHVVVTCYAP